MSPYKETDNIYYNDQSRFFYWRGPGACRGAGFESAKDAEEELIQKKINLISLQNYTDKYKGPYTFLI